jgi:hypothetical protein
MTNINNRIENYLLSKGQETSSFISKLLHSLLVKIVLVRQAHCGNWSRTMSEKVKPSFNAEMSCRKLFKSQMIGKCLLFHKRKPQMSHEWHENFNCGTQRSSFYRIFDWIKHHRLVAEDVIFNLIKGMREIIFGCTTGENRLKSSSSLIYGCMLCPDWWKYWYEKSHHNSVSFKA